MRWLQFTAAGKTSWGIVEGDKVIAVSGDPFGEWQRTAQAHPLKDVKIELPLVPRTFYCVGLNYLKHLKDAAIGRQLTAIRILRQIIRQPELLAHFVNVIELV